MMYETCEGADGSHIHLRNNFERGESIRGGAKWEKQEREMGSRERERETT